MLVVSVLRVTIVRLHVSCYHPHGKPTDVEKETPKYRLAERRDEEAIEILKGLATVQNSRCSLTVESLRACGATSIGDTHAKRHFSVVEILVYLRGLFQTRTLAISTSLA